MSRKGEGKVLLRTPSLPVDAAEAVAAANASAYAVIVWGLLVKAACVTWRTSVVGLKLQAEHLSRLIIALDAVNVLTV